MPQHYLRPTAHLTYAQVQQHYKQADSKRHQQYWNLIRLMSHPTKPLTVVDAAHAAGFGQRWARQLVHRYNQDGPNGLYDQRKHNLGRAPLLTASQKERLRDAISSGQAPDQGLWTSVKVADWIESATGYRPSEVTGWHYLGQLGFTLQVPRPKSAKSATSQEIVAFKKS